MGPTSLDRKNRGNCGEHELSKQAGFRKSLWVPFLVKKKRMSVKLTITLESDFLYMGSSISFLFRYEGVKLEI